VNPPAQFRNTFNLNGLDHANPFKFHQFLNTYMVNSKDSSRIPVSDQYGFGKFHRIPFIGAGTDDHCQKFRV
jgi:hypothetical protein